MKTKSKDLYVSDFKNKQLYSLLNLQPSYQRNPVWSDRQKVYLIDSILNGFPLPKIFINEVYLDSQTDAVFEIIDGQQRLTTILQYINNEFPLLKSKHPEPLEFNLEYEKKYFKDLSHEDKRKIMTFNLTCEVVEGTEDEIRQMFYRINSSSKTLNKQEILNSQYSGDFKKLVYKLEKEFADAFIENKILKKASLKRMDCANIVTQCLMSQIDGIVDSNKDRVYYKNYDVWNSEEVLKNEQNFKKIFKIITADIFKGKINQTHFKTKNSYIALHEFFHSMIFKYGKSLSKLDLNILYETFLDINRNIHKEGSGLGKIWFDNSLKSVDNTSSKLKRREVLDKSFLDYFNQKDSKRNFTDEERIIAWHKSDKVCKICNNEIISFDDYDLDHIMPHSLGGETTLENSQVTHISCNRSKKNKI